MRKLLGCSLICLLGTVLSSAAENKLLDLPLQDCIKLPDVCIEKIQDTRTFQLPAMPAKRGLIPVLRLRMYAYMPSAGGCNYHAQIEVNGRFLTRYKDDAGERFIGRSANFGLLNFGETIMEFATFAGNNIMTILAPSADLAEKETADGLGATFLFDISDLVRGVDGNSITFRNIRPIPAERSDLVIQDICIGYLDRKNLPTEASLIPERSEIRDAVKVGDLELKQAVNGGFSLQDHRSGLKLSMDTHWGMTPQAPVIFRAEDNPSADSSMKIRHSRLANGFSMVADWPDGLQLTRTLQLRNGRLIWEEVWKNNGNRAQGVIFRHRSWMHDKDVKFFVGGDCDTGGKDSAAHNPSLFLEDKAGNNGFGIVAESDWTRLLVSLRAAAGVTEIYSNHLGLEPGKSIKLEFSIDSEKDGRGYWGFINRLRKRWLGDDTLTAPWAFFCGSYYADAPGKDNLEKIRNSYAHLGPISVAYPDWSRLIGDVETIHQGKVPQKASGDLDIDEFIKYEHRKAAREKYAQALREFAIAAPEAKLIMITHPSMEIAYTPEAAKWPYSADEIKTRDGGCFNDIYYSQAYLYDQVKRGWAIYYYVPTAGGPYLDMLKADVRRYMEDMSAPGMYFDEFSFNHVSRGYSRYNYGKSDGYSADLDSNGNVLRFKSDNAMDSKTAREEIVRIVKDKQGIFYANTGPVLTSLQRLPVLYFTEGGNGLGCLGEAHLTHVPMAFGNFGDLTTVKGIFEGVKAALAVGTLYSPSTGSRLFKDENNFVCKLYPITIQDIDSGVICGKERLITSRNGKFKWAVADAPVKLYCYDKDGNLLLPLKDHSVQNGEITIAVPEQGLVIAELCPAQR